MGIKKYKVALLSAPLFSNNMGCNALTYGSLKILSEVADRLGASFEYYLVGNPSDGVIPDELKSYSIHLVEQLPDFSPKGLVRGIYRHNLKDRWREAAMLKDVDLFCDNAWGDSFSDIYGDARFAAVCHKLSYALRSKKPLVLLPQTIGPFGSAQTRKKAADMLKSAAAVYARDPLSVACAKDICPDLEVFETIDVALFMDYSMRSKPVGDRLTVGINPSGLLWRGGYTGSNQFGLKSDYRDVIRSIIEALLATGNVDVELIGHDVRGPNAGNGCDDYYVCKSLAREFPQCRVGPFFYSPVEAKSYISGLDMLTGSRMHCCIAAYSSGVPVFPLAYSRKFAGLFVERLDYPHVSDLREIESKHVVEQLMTTLGWISDIKAKMQERLDRLTDEKKAFVDNLADRLNIILHK